MTPDPRLNFLVDLRKAARLTQAEVARRFGLEGNQSYKSVAAWEKGESVPKDSLRARFMRYLWDDLRLHKEPTHFTDCWALLVECWHWEPLSEAERADLHLPPLTQVNNTSSGTLPTMVAGSTVQGNLSTAGGAFAGRDQYNFYGLPQLAHFVKLYRTEQDSLDEAAFAAQLTGYLLWVIERTENIELRGVKLRDGSQTTALKLAEVYVTLNAELVGNRRNDELKDLALEHILTAHNRLAVIGGPGCGKTTVLIYLAWVLANAIVNNDPTWAAEKLGLRLMPQQPTLPLPIYLPLSAYARQRFGSALLPTDNEQTLLDFLPNYLHRNVSSIKALPADFVERLLTSGRHVILLLDGLDEVADEGERRLVREAIENLVTSRQQIRVAVTCRTVAFQGRSVLARGFQQVNVRPLDEEQVALLVRKAYEYQYREDRLEQQSKTAELLAGIAKLEAEHARRRQQEERRLIDTPLMVRMLLVVHLSDRQLPQHRAELYKRFTDTIIHSDHAFDDSVAEALRKLAGNSPELLRALAFGMHQRGEQQGREIDEADLRILLKPVFANKIDAFVTLTRQRGTLLEERDGLYRFLHLAFQEFLAACYLVDDYAEDDGFPAKIRFFSDGQILNSWWREVALLIPGYYLTMERSRLAERFVRMLAGLDERQPISDWSPDVQLAATEIAATAALEWFPDDQSLCQALVQRLLYFFNTPALLNQTEPRLRALAGRALAALGDPRFRADGWFLPADPLLGFIELSGGTFIMGSDPQQDTEASDNETPQYAVTLPTFYMARYPVTVGQFRAYIEATGKQPRWADLVGPDNHPVNNVTWFEATRYCQWLTQTLRTWDKTPPALAARLAQGWQIMLPSEAEWERAARGSKSRLYPWGNDPVDPNRANYDETGIETTSAVGCFPAGATPEGIEELSGNAWEWTRSRYVAYPYPGDEQGRSERERVTAEGIESTDRFVQRGGSHYSNVSSLRAPRRVDFLAGSIGDNNGLRLVVGGAAPGS